MTGRPVSRARAPAEPPGLAHLDQTPCQRHVRPGDFGPRVACKLEVETSQREVLSLEPRIAGFDHRNEDAHSRPLDHQSLFAVWFPRGAFAEPSDRVRRFLPETRPFVGQLLETGDDLKTPSGLTAAAVCHHAPACVRRVRRIAFERGGLSTRGSSGRGSSNVAAMARYICAAKYGPPDSSNCRATSVKAFSSPAISCRRADERLLSSRQDRPRRTPPTRDSRAPTRVRHRSGAEDEGGQAVEIGVELDELTVVEIGEPGGHEDRNRHLTRRRHIAREAGAAQETRLARTYSAALSRTPDGRRRRSQRSRHVDHRWRSARACPATSRPPPRPTLSERCSLTCWRPQ